MNIINPFSNHYHAWKDLASYMKSQRGSRKLGAGIIATTIVFSSIVTGILTLGVGAPLAFRWMVKHLIKPSDGNQTKVKVTNKGTSILGVKPPTPAKSFDVTNVSFKDGKISNQSKDLQTRLDDKFDDKINKKFAKEVLTENS